MVTRDRWIIAGAIVVALIVGGSDGPQNAKGGPGMTTQVDQEGERNEYNFVADGSFENEISEWENQSDADGGAGPLWTIEHNGTYARSGLGYAQRLGGGSGQVRELWNLRVFDVVPEQVFHLEGFLTNGDASLGVRWYAEDGSFISSTFSVFTAGRFVIRALPPALAVRGQVFLKSSTVLTGRVDDIFAAQFPAHLTPLAETSPQASNNVQSTRSNVAYGDLADTNNSPNVDFIAPPNGRVEVTVSAFMSSSAAGSKAFMGYQIIDNTDSSVFQDTATERSAGSASANGLTLTRTSEASGLVPGRSYKARAKYRSASGGTTITAEDRRISVRPQTGVS